MITFNVSNLIATLIKFSTLVVFVILSFTNAIAQQGKVNLLGVSALQTMVVEGIHKPKKENFPSTFLHQNRKAFSITIHGFQDEKVIVSIYESTSNKAIYAINIEPKAAIYNATLLTKPLPKGTYHVVVQGESRVIPKEMTIE